MGNDIVLSDRKLIQHTVTHIIEWFTRNFFFLINMNFNLTDIYIIRGNALATQLR